MAEESTFDAESFMQTEVEGEMDTKYTPVPADDYHSVIDDIRIRAAKESVVLDVYHKLVGVDELCEAMGMEQLMVIQGIFLDIDTNGAIALGPNKNVKLGRLREAVGQNSGGPWNFAMLKGAGPIKISVSIKPDKDDDTILYNRVDKTLPVGVV